MGGSRVCVVAAISQHQRANRFGAARCRTACVPLLIKRGWSRAACRRCSSFSSKCGNDRARFVFNEDQVGRRRFTTAAAAVPISFDAMASRRITMHRCHKPEKSSRWSRL
jgi:hypothetical protein